MMDLTTSRSIVEQHQQELLDAAARHRLFLLANPRRARRTRAGLALRRAGNRLIG